MLPVIADVPLHCINEAAVIYHVPAKLIIAVLYNEQGKVGKVSTNNNGSYDIGPMQINSTWIPFLKKHGITRDDILYNACQNVRVGAWILGKSIANARNMLVGIGDYNSHTYQYNKIYYQRALKNYEKITQFIS